MKKFSSTILKYCVLISFSTCLVSAPVLAADSHTGGQAPSAAAMGLDLVLVRPVSLVATVLGTGIFVVSLPFSILGGNVGDAGNNLVLKPAKTTFIRPLGEFD